MDMAIRVENISKRYHIDRNRTTVENYKTLREHIADAARLPLDALTGRRRTESRKKEFWALRDVGFEVRPAEIIGIVGSNGAGKSTLLKILSRIVKPSAGRVELHGRVGSLLEVGTGFHPELSGRENIYLNGSILGMRRSEIARSFDEIVAFAEVEDFLEVPVKRYSSGMYVRLAFAVAAHLEPEILLVDEVLAVGDVSFQKKCLGKIRDVAHGGKTVVFVSHNMSFVTGLCQKALWLSQGRVRDYGEAQAIVRGFLDENSVDTAEVMDLSDMPRHNGTRLHLTKLSWESGLPLKQGEPARISFEAVALADVGEVAIGIGFSSMDGQRILNYETDLDDPRFDLSAGERIRVMLNIESIPLNPSRYTIDIGVRSGDEFLLDHIAGFCFVEVVPGDRTPAFVTAAGHPGVRLGAGWSLSRD